MYYACHMCKALKLCRLPLILSEESASKTASEGSDSEPILLPTNRNGTTE